MANRNIPGSASGANPTPRRTIPGAPPPASKSTNKKSKNNKDTVSNSNSNSNIQVSNATSAALIEKAPENPKQVANGLKVTPSDLAEQAELQTALATIDSLQSSEQSTNNTGAASTPAQKVISDRIAELSGKNKNATITVAIDELKILLDKVKLAESEKVGSKAERTAERGGEKAKLVLLLQFLHLFNLFHPQQGVDTFAPRSMPKSLEMSTAQQVAALAKLYDQLANGPLEGGGGDALEVLSNIENGSEEEVLEGVKYEKVKQMVLALTAPPSATVGGKGDGLDAPQSGFVPVTCPGTAPSFIQKSELEPEGGPVNAAPSSTTHKGEQGGKGSIMGGEHKGGADGTANAQVKQPITTTQINEPKLNWAAMAEEDDDDLGEAPVFEPISTSTSVMVTPNPGTPTEAAEASSSQQVDVTLSKSRKKPKQATARNAANGKGGKQVQQQQQTKAPKVDQDGFILQESKRTKYLQSKQQQQQQRGNAGGRGGAKSGTGGSARGGRNGGGVRKDGKPNNAQ